MLGNYREKAEIFEVPSNFRLFNSFEVYNKSQELRDKIERNLKRREISTSDISKHKLLNIKNIKIYKDKIEFILNISDYSHYIYTQKNCLSKNICRSISSIALLETSDNYFILAKMTKDSPYKDLYQCIPSLIEKNDCKNKIKGELDPKRAIIRKVKKELNLDISDKYESMECSKLIVGENISSIGFFYHINIDYSKEEMEDLFEGASNFEVEKLVFIKNNKKDIISFIGKENIKKTDYLKELFCRKSSDNNFIDYLRHR